MANIITGIRILFSFILLFTKIFSPTFYTVYIIAGISDVLDGLVARKLNLQSSFGEKLDTVPIFALLAQFCTSYSLPCKYRYGYGCGWVSLHF